MLSPPSRGMERSKSSSPSAFRGLEELSRRNDQGGGEGEKRGFLSQGVSSPQMGSLGLEMGMGRKWDGVGKERHRYQDEHRYQAGIENQNQDYNEYQHHHQPNFPSTTPQPPSSFSPLPGPYPHRLSHRHSRRHSIELSIQNLESQLQGNSNRLSGRFGFPPKAAKVLGLADGVGRGEWRIRRKPVPRLGSREGREMNGVGRVVGMGIRGIEEGESDITLKMV